MESFLSMLAGWFMGLWTWLVELNGMLQVVLVLLCVVASGVCAIIGKRMGSPMIVESGGQTWSRTLVTAIAWIAGVILMLIAVLAIAAVPWRRLSIQGRPGRDSRAGPRMSDKNQGIPKNGRNANEE